MRKCGECFHLLDLGETQQYHDCREDSPKVIVPAFKDGDSKLVNQKVGKIMTVWPRVSKDERGCGKFHPKSAAR